MKNYIFHKIYKINNNNVKIYFKNNSKSKTKYVKYKNVMIKLTQYKKNINKKKTGGDFIRRSVSLTPWDGIYDSIPLVLPTVLPKVVKVRPYTRYAEDQPRVVPSRKIMYYNRNPPPYNDNLLGKLFIKKQNGLRGMYLGGKKQKKQKNK
tara:strand:- start:331 stop:780 length:450 start_codon:yes stop_codon:yes gene_type:complete